uniref:NADH dehydrogenase subunit 6 n=1 Tax=Panagrolaimus sp. ES5 TaxID=591445 RepID=A0AC34G4J3_9BILA
MLTLVITTVVCASIIVFSMQTKHDLTSMMGFMFIASMVIMVFGFVAIIGGLVFHIRWLYMVYAGLAALLFMVYLAIDVQMIMGGKKYSIDPEDHIFAAIQLFMDIIYIFWMLLSLIGGSRRHIEFELSGMNKQLIYRIWSSNAPLSKLYCIYVFFIF